MRHRWSVFFTICSVVSVSAVLAEPPTPTDGQSKLRSAELPMPDGIYLVLRDGADSLEVLPTSHGQRMMIDHRVFRHSKREQAPKFLVVPDDPVLPLQLAKRPERVTYDCGHMSVYVYLTPEQIAVLGDHERADPESLLTVVVHGRVVTTQRLGHAVAQVKIVIPCRPTERCDSLLVELAEFVDDGPAFDD